MNPGGRGRAVIAVRTLKEKADRQKAAGADERNELALRGKKGRDIDEAEQPQDDETRQPVGSARVRNVGRGFARGHASRIPICRERARMPSPRSGFGSGGRLTFGLNNLQVMG